MATPKSVLDGCAERLDEATEAVAKTRRVVDVIGGIAMVGGVVWVISILVRKSKPKPAETTEATT